MQKGDGDAATWLLPNTPTALIRGSPDRGQGPVRAVGHRAEHDVMARVLATRPGTRLPASGKPVVTSRPRPGPTESASTKRSDVWYANCTAVRAAGKAPIRRGEPGYDRHLDRDGDGIACE